MRPIETTDDLKEAAISLQAEATKFILELEEKYPGSKVVMVGELESGVGMAPVSASNKECLVPTFVRLLCSHAAKVMQMHEAMAAMGVVPGRPPAPGGIIRPS